MGDVVNFPGQGDTPEVDIEQSSDKQKEVLSQEQLDEIAEQGIETVLQSVMKNRKSGLKRFEEKVDTLRKTRMLSDQLENSLRDVYGALRGNFTALEALDQFVEMMQHDLIGMFQALDHHKGAIYSFSVTLQAMKDVLVERGMMTEEDFRAAVQAVQKKMINPAPEPPAEPSEQ